MLARFRTQLRLLFFTTAAVAALAMPSGASAATTLTLAADGDPVPTEADGGNGFKGGDFAQYDVVVENTGADPSTNATLRITFDSTQLQFEDFSSTPDGGDFYSCISETTGTTTQVDCDFAVEGAGDPLGEELEYMRVLLSTVNGFTGPDTMVYFAAVNDGVVADTMNDNTTWDYVPTCTDGGYYYGTTFTRAELQTDGTVSLPIGCTDPDGGALTITPAPGTYGTVTGSGTSATFTASAPTLASPTGFYEYFVLTLTDDEGDTTTANIAISVYTQSNTSSAVSGPTAFAVPAAGGTVTYTNTVRNAGPDALGRVGFGWEISDKATIVSATAAGAAATCESANYGDEGMRAFGCGSAAMPAVGASVVGTLTVRYAAGEKGLTLPTTVKVTALAGPDSTTGAEDRTYSDNESVINTALTAYVAPANPTQGTSGNDSYTGTTGNDTYSGGGGNDTFFGAAGNDVFYGGAGDDVFDGGAGNDLFYGGTGDDSGFGGLGSDTMYGGLGNDRLVGGDASDKLFGQDGRDRLLGSTGGDVVSGGAGNDVVRGGTGADRVFCGTGTDIATGDNGMDLIGCRDGKPGDTLSGGYGLDICVGDIGDRFLSCETIVRV